MVTMGTLTWHKVDKIADKCVMARNLKCAVTWMKSRYCLKFNWCYGYIFDTGVLGSFPWSFWMHANPLKPRATDVTCKVCQIWKFRINHSHLLQVKHLYIYYQPWRALSSFRTEPKYTNEFMVIYLRFLPWHILSDLPAIDIAMLKEACCDRMLYDGKKI